MDETLKPLRIPPQISLYADKHNVSHLVQHMVISLVVDQPDDPISYLISFLQRRRVECPQVMLLGPPAVGKHTLAKRLSTKLRAVHVTVEGLLQGQSEQSRLSKQVRSRDHAQILPSAGSVASEIDDGNKFLLFFLFYNSHTRISFIKKKAESTEKLLSFDL
ncbi:hypothetical protein AMECASPLE_030813 [Ameca splendens]|uniref:Adenylate kinase n=1 Tax=Ameca splendens TaxID=208324 RepID=A0ABV1A2A3_9TELE